MNTYISNKFSEYRKVNWKQIFKPKNVIKAELEFYKSDYVDISKYNGKIYVDPEFGVNEPKSNIDYVLLNGIWEIDSYVENKDEFIVKLIDGKSGQSIEFSFDTISDKINFINKIYSNKPVKQINSGLLDTEKIINKTESNNKGLISTLTTLFIVGSLLYKLRKK